jgi:hypothetical protein
VRQRETGTPAASLDDLDELQIVTKRECRRGYLAQANGRPMRFRYRKIMATPDGLLLVSRPPVGQERLKITLRRIGMLLGVILAVAWPITVLALIVLVAVVASAIR